MEFKPAPSEPPPRGSVGRWAWMRRNLFASPADIALTLFGVWLIWTLAVPALQWIVLDGFWVGDDIAACRVEDRTGFCFPYVKAKFLQFMFGRYPEDERWRVLVTFLILGGGLGWLARPGLKAKGWVAAFLFLIYPVLATILMAGGALGLVPVDTNNWGGLTVTLIVAVTGIAASLPLGVLLALGRRSHLPIIRLVCIVFIEGVRGVPLITVLFMASVMLPLFLPPGMDIDNLLRALIGVALFSSAYMAEVVRGGLQAIPRGQTEAAFALGLGYWRTMGLIILPQALTMVIPGIVNTFIGLFKDTTLVLIVGIFDLLGTIKANSQDPAWFSPSTASTGYVFAGAIFWVFCYGMSRYSQTLEIKLNAGRKRL